MAQEIEFSVMAPSADLIQPLLDPFTAETGIQVRLRLLAWDTAWSTLVRAALYKDGPDVSEMGTTWIGDLVDMHALRPFNTAEVAGLGNPDSFTPPAWRSATRMGKPPVWSIPWLAGARLLILRPDLLERAGLDPQMTFDTGDRLEEAIRRLQESGVRYPWTVPTGFTHTTLLNIASWVWSAGGDFLSPDGKATRFMEPEALAGMAAYFRLGRYLRPEIRHLNGLEPDGWFLQERETALTISGAWSFGLARQQQEAEGQRIDSAVPLGNSFVGGSNLVIWKYCRDPEAALKLIRFLTRTQAELFYCPRIGLLPARSAALEQPPFATDRFWQTAVHGLQTGRFFPAIRLWGLVEDRLTLAFQAVWADVLEDPARAERPQASLVKHLAPLASRLDPLLAKG